MLNTCSSISQMENGPCSPLMKNRVKCTPHKHQIFCTWYSRHPWNRPDDVGGVCPDYHVFLSLFWAPLARAPRFTHFSNIFGNLTYETSDLAKLDISEVRFGETLTTFYDQISRLRRSISGPRKRGKMGI